LIEGTTERLLLPKIIQKVDVEIPEGRRLGSQYLSVIEVGGAYAHIFFDLVEFLELRTLVITDMDSVKQNGGAGPWVACPVNSGQRTSNACIKTWFGDDDVSPAALIAKANDDKVQGKKRITFQVPEVANDPCGRSFEDAFMLANPLLFPRTGTTGIDHENNAWEEAKTVKKSKFALEHALTVQEWNIPRYIREGLLWLSGDDAAPDQGANP
jgi:hypothetical protein